jgi:lycopene beta-cyclase
MKKDTYDIVICGSGAAGLLLALRLHQNPFFKDHSVLLVDAAIKNTNDRTWSFWEQQQGSLEEIVHHRWEHGLFKSQNFTQNLHLNPYAYKMIRGIDFYNHILPQLEANPQFDFLHAKVNSLENQDTRTAVHTDRGTFVAAQVFSSIYRPEWVAKQRKYPVLQQHFVGWIVETENPCFTPEQITFMDFDIPNSNATRFMYVLPFTPTKALLEDTFFSADLLPKAVYEKALTTYLEKIGAGSFSILEREQGSIPMTAYPFHKHNTPSLLHIGTAGGWTKASTGYTFQNTLEQTERLVAFLQTKKPLSTFYKHSKFAFYDLLFLDVLARHNARGSELFQLMFQKNSVQRIFKFLSNKTHFWEDLMIMRSFPIRWFVHALWKRFF